MRNRNLWLIPFLVSLYIIIFSVVSFRLYERIGAFGCGDECINYTAGYFINSGKSLYSQIFFNHQPALAYLSAAIQQMTHPRDIYHLVLYHRLFVMVYALGMGVLLLRRFRLSAALFLILYEGTKFYVYGYQFIPEAFIVFPLVYLLGLVWESVISSKTLSRADIFLAVIFGALVIWMREPYVPLAAILCAVLLWRARANRFIPWALVLAGFLLVGPFVIVPFRVYVEQVIVINAPAVGSVVGKGSGISWILSSIFYPISIYVYGVRSYFRIVEFGVGALFWAGVMYWWKERKAIVPIGILFGILALAAVRVVPPGTMYFEAFHMLDWYALFVMSTALLVTSVKKKYARNVLISLFFIFALWSFCSPKSFIWERVNRNSEFESQYAKYTQYSLAIRNVSQTHTVFLDMWDDIIYWESGSTSSYPLSLYIPAEATISKYQNMRHTMFVSTPPDIYYSCPKSQTVWNTLPADVASTYIQLYSLGRPGCMYIKRSVVETMTLKQWDKLRELGITQP